MTHQLRTWGPALLWAALIFALSSRPTLPLPLTAGRDKLAHFGAYAVLGVLLGRARTRVAASLWVVLLLGLAYGASDEIHQYFVPGRSPELADWVADAFGVATGILCYHLWRGFRPVDTARS